MFEEVLLKYGDRIKNVDKAKTYHGHAYDVIKSMLQKSVRRNEREQCTDAIFESLVMYIAQAIRSKETGEGSTSSSKGNVTNTLTRLKVIAVEDIGIGDPSLVVFLKERFDKLVVSGSKKNSKVELYLDRERFEVCVKLAYEIALRLTDKTKKKCRLPSHLRAAMWRLYHKNCSGHKQLEEFKSETISSSDNPTAEFKKLWLQKSDECFYHWFSLIFKLQSKNDGSGWERDQDASTAARSILVWIIKQNKCANKSKIYTVLLDWFDNVATGVDKDGGYSEFWIFGVQIILVSMLDGDVDSIDFNSNVNANFNSNANVDVDFGVDENEFEWKTSFKHFLDKKSLTIHPHYIDIHTREGKKNSTHLQFVNEGALLDEECKLIERGREHYETVYKLLVDLKIDFKQPPLTGSKEKRIEMKKQKQQKKKLTGGKKRKAPVCSNSVQTSKRQKLK